LYLRLLVLYMLFKTVCLIMVLFGVQAGVHFQTHRLGRSVYDSAVFSCLLVMEMRGVGRL
jgi:hypothetical protein